MDAHTKALKGFYNQSQKIFQNSGQAIYLYLNDTHKLCNMKFAKLLGYSSAKEWSEMDKPFTSAFVDEKSQSMLVHAYQDAVEKSIGSAIPVTWKTKNSKRVKTDVILVPVAFNGSMMAMHFITK